MGFSSRIVGMDEEKLKKWLELLCRIFIAGTLIYFMWDVVVKQHEFFS